MTLPEQTARPGAVIAVHLNYRSRAAQRGRTPAHPSYFLKSPGSVCGPGIVERPEGTELLTFEGEIALIIGQSAFRVAPQDGWTHVAAVGAANDLGLQDLKAADGGSNLRSKGGDGFTPLGPTVIDAARIDPAALRVRTWRNGELVQEDTSDTLIFDFGSLVADLSRTMTLQPGDIILTGTPAGAGVAEPGDVIEVEVDAPTAPGAPTTGRLRTTVVDGPALAPWGAGPRVDAATRAAAYGVTDLTLTGPPAVSDGVVARLREAGTATLSAILRARGLDGAVIEGVAPLRAGNRLAGRARTLRLIAHRGDLFAQHGGGHNAQKRLFDTVDAGEVVVIEARGVTDSATLGDVLALRARHRGAAGVVTDGAVRDADAVADTGLPVFARGAHPSVIGRRHVPWETDVAITCGAVAVLPGDVLVGDADGVVVVPAAVAAEVAKAARAKFDEDEWVADQVRDGHPIDGLFPMNTDWQARYAAATETSARTVGEDAP